MNPIKVSAQLAAFVWFTSGKTDKRNAAALHFAQENWRAFLPLAHNGLGRLLLQIAERPSRTTRSPRRRAGQAMAASVRRTTCRLFSVN